MTDASAQKACPQCKSAVHADAARCPHCTSWIDRSIFQTGWAWAAVAVLFVVLLATQDALALPVNIVEVGPEF